MRVLVMWVCTAEAPSNHPSSITRIQHLEAIMPKALEYYSKSGGAL